MEIKAMTNFPNTIFDAENDYVPLGSFDGDPDSLKKVIINQPPKENPLTIQRNKIKSELEALIYDAELKSMLIVSVYDSNLIFRPVDLHDQIFLGNYIWGKLNWKLCSRESIRGILEDKILVIERMKERLCL